MEEILIWLKSGKIFLSSLGRDGSNGTPFDAVGLILSSTNPLTYQNLTRKIQKFSSTFLSSFRQDGSNGTPFDAVGLILSSTHPLPCPNLIRKIQNFSKYLFDKKSIWNHKLLYGML